MMRSKVRIYLCFHEISLKPTWSYEALCKVSSNEVYCLYAGESFMLHPVGNFFDTSFLKNRELSLGSGVTLVGRQVGPKTLEKIGRHVWITPQREIQITGEPCFRRTSCIQVYAKRGLCQKGTMVCQKGIMPNDSMPNRGCQITDAKRGLCQKGTMPKYCPAVKGGLNFRPFIKTVEKLGCLYKTVEKLGHF